MHTFLHTEEVWRAVGRCELARRISISLLIITSPWTIRHNFWTIRRVLTSSSSQRASFFFLHPLADSEISNLSSSSSQEVSGVYCDFRRLSKAPDGDVIARVLNISDYQGCVWRVIPSCYRGALSNCVPYPLHFSGSNPHPFTFLL